MSRRTRMPTLEVRSVVVVLLRVSVLTVLYSVARIRTQGLPPARPQNPDPDHHAQTFHVSRQLPDGEEMEVYFIKGVQERLFYLVEQDHTPLQLTVTPCASPVTGSLHRRPLPPEDYYDQPAENPFREQLEGPPENHVVLANWSGDSRHTYHDPSAPAGLYVLDVTSTLSDSYVRVLATSTGASHPMYPVLPAKRGVDITRISDRTFTFRWPDAQPVNPGRQVEYCVSVTKVRNFATHCSLMAHSRGDKKPVLSKKDRWGFSWERDKMRNRRRKANPVKAMSPRKILMHQCVESKREFTFSKARKGKTYYVDAYVVDKVTNKAEAFQGTRVKMPGKHTKSSSSRQIIDGERKILTVKKSNVPQKVTFKAKRQIALLSVELGVCPGKIPFEIYHNSTRVHRSVVKKWKRVRMKNVLPGTYLFKFPRLKRKKSFVSMHVTSKPSALTLPRNMSIKVFDSMTTCTNLTVAWMGTHKKQKYCLYVKEASKIRSLKRHKCSSAADRPKSERVLCKRYKNSDISKAVMVHTVTGLQPDTKYVVDVYLSRGRSGPVAYKSVSVKTKAGC
ncbi:protein NDNF-like [Babylonia areolata]|uniref:protein NDNF-like n=1 Tax=Babylonia areolata TaxID=304850 RepID=UPI003FD02E90